MIRIDNNHIKKLDEKQLTILYKILLRAEAISFGIRQGSANERDEERELGIY